MRSSFHHRRSSRACLALPLLMLAGCSQGGPHAPASAPASAEPVRAIEDGGISGPIRLNQLGFLPGAHKLALVEGAGEGARFEVVDDAAGGKVVLRGALAQAASWPPAGRTAALADLDALRAPGRYRIRVDGLAPSDPFPVATDAYAALGDAALKAFYFNRASTALPQSLAGAHARAAGHPDTDVRIHPSAASPGRPAGGRISAPKGWYDAGDYNKYVVNSGIATYTLLAAYEHFPDWFAHRSTGIPESGNAAPDILDEAWWNLEWLLAMQDPGDGGVYHKLTGKQFDGSVMPAQARGVRYVVQKSTAATLDFAALMAVASRIYAGQEAQFPGAAARMRAAAESAWRWARANPDVLYRQPADVLTGEYGDAHLADEFAWAAAELYLLTGDPEYYAVFAGQGIGPGVPGWPDVGGLAWISLASHLQQLPSEDARVEVQARMLTLADELAARWRQSPWRLSMEAGDFRWGSNAVALNQAMMLVQGYRLSGQREHLDAAQSLLDYVLGRNPLGVSFVTGHGLRTPQHIHHRPSEADGVDAPVPGLLAGGPNPGQQDAKDCPVPYPSSLPALSWLDHQCSYASNEVAINWNAPLVYVAAAIQVLTPATLQGDTTRAK